MKILWFSLSPCSSAKRFGKEKLIQGWMISLENEMKRQEDISLEVAYVSNIDEKPFEFEGVKYYPIYLNANTPVGKLKNIYGSKEKKDKDILPILKNIIEQSNPDIIHVHGTESFFCSITNEITDIPIVYSIQGFIAPITEQFFAGYSIDVVKKYDSICSKIMNNSISVNYNNYLYDAKREKKAIKSASYLIGRTNWDRSICKLYNPNAEYFVVNEILRPVFYNTVWKKDKFSDKLILISTLSPGIYKGYETLLKAAALLKEHSTFDFEWRVAGCDKDSKWVKISEDITGHFSEDCNIKLLGMKSAEELAEELKNADIYCHTSHIENSPNSVCEAMLIGMPVIATFVGGTDSMLHHDKEGILYQDGDPYALAAYIVELHDDFAKAKTLGDNARKVALARHDKDIIVKDLLSTYNSIVKYVK